MRERHFGPRKCALSELTDDELIAEVQERRRQRGLPAQARSAATTAPVATPWTAGLVAAEPAPAPLHRPRAVRQWLANLELPESASLPDVEAAFERLRSRYEPATQDSDEKRRVTAERLMGALRNAYDGLRLHLTSVNR